MSDIALIWNPDAFGADIAMAGPDLATDDGLKTAIIISLFTDARANADDPLPQAGADRRGWWGDVAPLVEGDHIGSRLWLLSREKQLSSVLGRAEEYAKEALAWLLADGVAAEISVTAEVVRDGVLGLGVIIVRPDGPARQRYDFVWEAT